MSAFGDDERLGESDFATASQPSQKNYREIDDELEARHGYGEQAAKEHAKEALEELYASEFPIDDPPESFERYEAEVTLRHLRGSIKSMFTGTGRHDRHFVIDMTDQEVTEVPEPTDTDDPEKIAWDQYVDEAKQRIDVMATYGAVSEPHIAAVTEVEHSEVREYATETLSAMREDDTKSKSLTAAIRDWWQS